MRWPRPFRTGLKPFNGFARQEGRGFATRALDALYLALACANDSEALHEAFADRTRDRAFNNGHGLTSNGWRALRAEDALGFGPLRAR